MFLDQSLKNMLSKSCSLPENHKVANSNFRGHNAMIKQSFELKTKLPSLTSLVSHSKVFYPASKTEGCITLPKGHTQDL